MDLTLNEVKWLSETPEGLRLVADYNEMQATMADGMGFPSSYHEKRKAELLAEAQKIEDEV